MFSTNPDFGIMEQAYMKLKTQSELLHGSLSLYAVLTCRQTQTCNHPRNLPSARLLILTARKRKRNCRWRLLFQSETNPQHLRRHRSRLARQALNQPVKHKQHSPRQSLQVLPLPPFHASGPYLTFSPLSPVSFSSVRGISLRFSNPCTRTGGKVL